MRARALQNRPAERCVSAAVGYQEDLGRRYIAFCVTGRRDIDLHRMALDVNIEALLTRELDLNRSPRLPRHQRGVVLHAHILFAAEPAADEHGPAPDAPVRNLEHRGDLALFVINRLRSRINGKLGLLRIALCGRSDPEGFRYSDGTFRFHKGVVGLGRRIVRGNGKSCFGNRLIGISPIDIFMREYVAVRMQLRRIFCESSCRTCNRIKNRVIHFDKGQNLV